MTQAFLSLLPIALLGALLRAIMPGAEEARLALNRLVLFAFLPALVFRTIMTCPMDATFWQVPVTAAASSLAMVGAGFLVFHFLPISRATKGAMILAAAFGNVTYLGLPLLQGLFPGQTTETATVAVLFEVMTSTLNLTLGSVIAIAYGTGEQITFRRTALEALKLPPLWALALALVWRASGIPCPGFLLDGAGVMAASVSGMMILSLGMALRFRTTPLLALVIPVAGLKLFASPAVASLVAGTVGLSGLTRDLAVLEAAMPSQLLSFVIASRFRLDEATLSAVIFGTTIVSLFTLPVIQAWLVR
ncbi:MAG: AEC family transporter [Terrimicrobiaceae bacterium]|nr:AEC family transporter [Terrimicrobiaceae bacterium]